MTRLRECGGGHEVWVALFLFCSGPAFAQEAPSLRAHHSTMSAGMTWMGGYAVGDASAQLRGNAAGPSAPAFTLFTADSRVDAATAMDVRVGVAMTPRIAIDGGISFGRPRIGISITGDAETPSQDLEGEKIEQYQVDGGITWQLPIAMGRKMAPYVLAGGGYLRQLHEDRALAETGQIYYAGGGARYWLKGGHGASKAVGVRGDARVSLRKNGIDFENKMRAYPTMSLSLFVGF